MIQLLVWLAIIMIAIFIFRIGAFLWRVLGVFLIVFLLWVFKDDLIYQVNHFAATFDTNDLSEFFNRIWEGFKTLITGIVQFIQNLFA
ncbi:MAG: hypothetical protein ACK5MW_10180 [Enterococcus sp.]